MASHPRKKRTYPFKRQFNRKIRRIVFMLVAAAIATGINYYNNNSNSSNNTITQQQEISAFSKEDQQVAISKIRKAKDDTNAQFWVGFNARVIKILKDDTSGSRHQKFLISLAPDITLLVAHNIDLSTRIPIAKGDSISLYGRYEWNNRGGVMHWTHHDPKGKQKGGWIRANGKTYR